MTSAIFQFGEVRPEYPVPVLNERAVRAAAGLLFGLALISFMNAWLLGNFQPTRVFVIGFLIEFTIRVAINPRWAPVMIMAQWVVRYQEPEWTGAPQKRFAWLIGFALAAIMLYLVVLQRVIGPVNLIVCALCLTLLFFEAAFGICLGCSLYNRLRKTPAQLCPGGVCAPDPVRAAPVQWTQAVVVLLFVLVMVGVGRQVYTGTSDAHSLQPEQMGDAASVPAVPAAVDEAERERCKVPEFAKAMGHEQQWKLHNHCQ